jgi:hypothetical protein
MAKKAEGDMKKALEELADEMGEDEEPEEDEEEKAAGAEIDLEALAGHLASHFDVDIAPLVEQAEKQAQLIEAQDAKIASLQKALEAFQQRRDADLPRFVMQLEKRASEAEETVVEEGDPLLKMKPVETVVQQSGAASFFPAAK